MKFPIFPASLIRPALLASLVVMSVSPAFSQDDSSAKRTKKTLTFQPGAKAPDEIAQAAPNNGDVKLSPTGPISVSLDGNGAQTGDETGVSPLQIVDVFFKQLEAGNVDAAYSQLLKGSKINDSASDVANLKEQTRKAIAGFGDIMGHDFVESKEVGPHLMSLMYISRGKQFPLRWRFYFYKVTDSWRLIDIRINDRLADMFEEEPAAAA